MPPWFHRFVKLAPPASVEKPLIIITIPVTIKARIAMTLINANQNSISPNSFTVAKFIHNKITSAINPGIHCGIVGNQYWV